jgi:hypothetical protein
MSSDEFLEFDDDAQTQAGSSGGSPFLILAGVLVTILILASICTVYLLTQRNQDNGEEIAARQTQNAEIAVTNAAVTQTIAAMETENAQPATETPTPSPVATEIPTETPTIPLTDTPVVPQDGDGTPVTGDTGTGDDGTGDDGTGDTGDTGTGDTGTGDDGTSGDDGSATGDTGQGGVVTGGESTPAFSGGTDSTLPQTGLDTWAAVLLGIFFIGLFIAARRLRSS